MKKFPVKLTLYFLVAIPIFISCENNDPTAKVDRMSLGDQMILENAGNYLTFSTQQAFEDSVQLMSKLNRSQLDSWEKSKSFSSLRKVYEAIVDHEIRQADLEEQMILKDNNLIRTMKHKTSPLIGEANAMIEFSLEDGVSYRLFNPLYAHVLNKDGIVKVGKSLFKYGEEAIGQIVDGNEKEISNLLMLNKNGETENLRYYPVKSSTKLLESRNVRLGSNQKYCEKTSDHPNYNTGDYRLKAWAKGTQITLFNYSFGNYHNRLELSVQMQFTRKTWYGSVNHRSENYSSDGEWRGYSGTTIPYNIVVPTNTLPYDLPNGFDGSESQPYHVFWTIDFYSPYADDYYLALLGTFNFRFLDITCTAQ